MCKVGRGGGGVILTQKNVVNYFSIFQVYIFRKRQAHEVHFKHDNKELPKYTSTLICMTLFKTLQQNELKVIAHLEFINKFEKLGNFTSHQTHFFLTMLYMKENIPRNIYSLLQIHSKR